LWEYTLKNPYSKKHEYREKIRHQYQERMKRKCCDGCLTNGFDTQLFHSVYINDIYCEDCLENVSDGDGGLLGDHKFEPI
jgi:hypothetical protein